MRRLALPYLLTGALPALAAWQPVRCPEVPPPPAELYETVRVLTDFQAGDSGLRVNVGGQQAPGRVVADAAGGRDGKTALRIDYDFAGGKPIEYLDLGTPFVLDQPVTAIGVWYKQTGGPLHLLLRFRDPSGETHQIPMAMPRTASGWQFAACRLDTTAGTWGGDADGKLQYPAAIASIVADRPSREFDGAGTLWIDDVAILKDRPRADGLTIEVDDPAPGLLYAPGAQVKVRLSGGTGYRWQVTDEAGRERQQGTDANPVIALPEPGYYALRVAMLVGERVAAEQILSCAALAPAGGRNDFVGLGTHFRNGGYPLVCQDLLARYGIAHFRDEISWSGVERQPGQYALPAPDLKYIDAAMQRGLEPLLILDYGNPHYEAGGFPTEAASIKAYAEYGAQMARMLAGKVKAFEIWNEWSGACGMSGKPKTNTPEAYGAMLRAASASLKAVDPNLTVIGIGGEHSEHHFEQILGMVKAAGPDSMDAWSVHSYRYARSPESSDLVGEIRRIAAANAELGLRAPIWLTEIGWPTHLDFSRGVDEFTQARYIVRTMALLQSTGLVDRVYWYDLKDDGLKPEYNEHNFGVIRHQDYALAPKPAAVALSVFARLTAGATLVAMESKGDAHLVRYSTADGQDLLVAWSTGEDIAVTVTGQDLRRIGLMGAPLDGPVVLTESPQYILGRQCRVGF